MISAVRRFLALLAICGLFVSTITYVWSYFGATLDGMPRWAIALHIGVFALLLPMYAVEYPALKRRTFFWKGFARSRPNWVVPSIKLFGLFFIIHFALFLAQSHAASPEIKNGEFVLDDHGTVVRILTKSQYQELKGAELRLFATGWMFFYFVPTVYWWFPKARE